MLNPFVDLALINPSYRYDAQRDLAAKGLFNEGAVGHQPFMVSAGCGIKLHMNTNFILSLDVGKAIGSPFSDLMIGMGTTYVF